MLRMSDASLGGVLSFAPLPPFATPQALLADALPILDPPSALTVTEAAQQNLRVQLQGAWQNYDRDTTPYMVEPADVTQSRRFNAVGFVGPSQSGKTKMLETVAAHAVTCDPRTILIIHMTKADRDKWVEEKLDPTILNSPALAQRLGSAKEDSTFSRKRFKGMRVLVGYPTPTVLSGGTYAMVLLTDVDHMPLVLGPKDRPEGSPFRMARRRVTTFMSRGMVLAESSPALPVMDPTWKPDPARPHELPPVAGGIVVIYNEGTRARWYWECGDCGEEFEPRFDRLDYDQELQPEDAGAAAIMPCPHCGSVHEHKHKLEFNRRALAGRGGWRHEGVDGKLVALGDADMRKVQVASYHLNGAAATFSNWADIVANYEAARRRALDLGDDSDLAAVHYTEIGVPHQRPAEVDGSEVGLTFLQDHLQPAERGIAPSWTRFITISVDVQQSHFPVQITAWSELGTCQVVNRFDLKDPPVGAPNTEAVEDDEVRRLDPARYIEDWQVLEALATRVTPVEGAGYGLLPLVIGVDFQGKAGVSDNAEMFLKGRKRAGEGDRWRLTRGEGGFRKPFRIRYAAPERGSKGTAARNLKLLTIATDRMKDTLYAALKKSEGGVGAHYIGAWMTDLDQLGEYVAEERTDKGWVKKQGVVRNEGTDLSTMARALAEHKGLMNINPDVPPAWALGGSKNTNAVPEGAKQQRSKASGMKQGGRINFLAG